MKALLQRTLGPCEISYDEKKSSFEGPGLVALLAWGTDDEVSGEGLCVAEEWILNRTLGLRVFPDAEGKMNLSLSDYCQQNSLSGGVLWVPQFTLMGQLNSGYRPSFSGAMEPVAARKRFEMLEMSLQERQSSNVSFIFGKFGADMMLSFSNWGPVTLALERKC